jgi:probable F420-dependent oxidoreductase
MGFGVTLPQFGRPARHPAVRAHIRDVAVAADRLGYDVLWTAEHLIFPAHVATPYPYGPGLPFDVTDPILDVTATLSFVAALTTRVRLGSAVVVLPYHHPIALAKAIATLDVLSNGRVLLGVASGWLREEFEMLGIPFRERGARTDESIALLKALWCDETMFRGRFFRIDHGVSFPKPVQHPHPPIWIGGDSNAALRRVARFGDGWMAVPKSLDHLVLDIETIRRHAEAAGRDPATIGVASSGAARSMTELLDLLPRLHALGITIVNVPALAWTQTVPEALELLQEFAERAGLLPNETRRE